MLKFQPKLVGSLGVPGVLVGGEGGALQGRLQVGLGGCKGTLHNMDQTTASKIHVLALFVYVLIPYLGQFLDPPNLCLNCVCFFKYQNRLIIDHILKINGNQLILDSWWVARPIGHFVMKKNQF